MTNSGPFRGGELNTSVICEDRGNGKPQNPGGKECSSSTEPPPATKLINHSEEVGETMARGKRTYQVQVDLREAS